MVIAIAVGFYMQWNPTVIVILLGVFFVGTISYLIGICRHLIMPSVNSWKEKIHKAYRKYIRRIAVNCGRKVNRWKLEDTGENHISLLSPIDDFKRHKEYIIRLKNAIDQPNVFNIALTGSYGAGKSSILKTFKAYYPEYHYVNVSLASFVEVNMSESDSTPKSNEDSFEEQLEYSILQQLFYHVKATNIPESRFGRIERTSRKKRSVHIVVCCSKLVPVLSGTGDKVLLDSNRSFKIFILIWVKYMCIHSWYMCYPVSTYSFHKED